MNMLTSRMRWRDSVSSEEKWRWGMYISGFFNFRGCWTTCCNSIVLSCPRIGSAVLILPRRPKLVQTNGHVVVERDQNLTPILAAQFFCHSNLSKGPCLTVFSCRQSWVDGKPPVKIVSPKYDGPNSYQPDPAHIWGQIPISEWHLCSKCHLIVMRLAKEK